MSIHLLKIMNHIALFGGEDGLKFYRQILKDAHKVVNEKNIIAFEHAYNHKAMAELVKQHFLTLSLKH